MIAKVEVAHESVLTALTLKQNLKAIVEARQNNKNEFICTNENQHCLKLKLLHKILKTLTKCHLCNSLGTLKLEFRHISPEI